MRFKDFWQFVAPTRVVAGRGLLEGAGFEFAKEGAARVLIVTDEVVRGTGLVDRVAGGVRDGGLEVAGIYDAVPPDSDSAVVKACAEAGRAEGADSFLAVGGGSVMDTAKAANVVFTHGGEPREWEGYFGLPRDGDGLGRPQDLAPLAAIPTTAGTGSEMSFAAVIKDREQHVKFQVADFPMYPRLAILDPEATRTLPAPIAAATGMDAMTHAIEGYVSSEWNPHAGAYALMALRLIRDNLERAVADTGDEDARGNMLAAANLAIQPTSSGAIGIAHSLSHPCGAHYDVPHGVANAINLPVTIEWNA
ncbi:MAG: alcohol dehydrogenase, partial [Solirubrobacteraceae bacterium]|nr:alcohol dehydrogenase [Solirubrobacteraceae bacterium]